MKERILVTGATGKVGRELVRRLLDTAVDVRAATRRPDRARELLGPDVEVVELDYDRTETYDEAVQWADRVFLVPPPFDPEGDERLVPFLDWAVSSGSDHLVLLSAAGISDLDHVALRRIERRIERIGVPYTFLRPNIFMQNFAAGFVARRIRESGAFQLTGGAGKVSFVDSRDVAAAAAAVLTGDDHVDRCYTLTGPEALDHAQVAEILATAAGRPVRYEPVDEERMREILREEGWHEAHAGVFLDLLASIRNQERAAISPDLPFLLRRDPTPMRQFAEEHAQTWRTDG